MSNSAQLVRKPWNYCNTGSLAPTRSGLRPSAPQKPFRWLHSGSSLGDDGLSYGDYLEQAILGGDSLILGLWTGRI